MYAPALDEMYTAVKGKGAMMNGSKIKVSGTKDLIQALVCTGFPTDRATKANRLDTNFPYFEETEVLLWTFAMVTNRQRSFVESIVFDLPFFSVASGRMDLYWELQLKAWDVAAGGLILEEAGGKYTDMEGKAFTYKHAVSENEKFHIFGCNQNLYDVVLTIFENVRKEQSKK